MAVALTLMAGPSARAEDEEPVPPPPVVGYVPPAGFFSALQIGGYIDVGAAKAQGNGTSFAPNDERNPLDYGSDTFATAVNSRGDVASTNSNGQFTNGFLPSTLNIGGHASVFVSTVDLDVKFQPEGSWYMGFLRLQFLPRVNAQNVEADQFLVEQAFARIAPFASQELTLTVGKFDGVFGIEYLENEAPVRTNITPSLIARYTTGQQLGAKLFYKLEIPQAWSALSLNIAGTTNPPVVPALDPSAISLSGAPVFTGRLGYELDLPKVQLKLGGSASFGPRGDQTNPLVDEEEFGIDARLVVGWFSFAAEGVQVQWFEGGSDKVGTGSLVSPFLVKGYYANAAFGVPIPTAILRKITGYLIWSQRFGGWTGFAFLDTARVTGGLRVDFGENVALKAEYLHNMEILGAPNVANDVMTSSAILYF